MHEDIEHMCDDMAFFYFFNANQKLEIRVVKAESKSKANPPTDQFRVQDAAATATLSQRISLQFRTLQLQLR